MKLTSCTAATVLYKINSVLLGIYPLTPLEAVWFYLQDPRESLRKLSFCNSITAPPISLESCSNPQKMRHVFAFAMKKIF